MAGNFKASDLIEFEKRLTKIEGMAVELFDLVFKQNQKIEDISTILGIDEINTSKGSVITAFDFWFNPENRAFDEIYKDYISEGTNECFEQNQCK